MPVYSGPSMPRSSTSLPVCSAIGEELLGDQAPVERVLRLDPGGGEDVVLRPGEADQPGQPLGAAAAGDHPEVHLRQRELAAAGGQPDVAGQREFEADAE